MNPQKSVDENYDEFQRLVIELESALVTITEQDKCVILLNSIPEKFRSLRVALKYGRQLLEVDDIISALKMKELEFKSDTKKNQQGEGLFVKDKKKKKGKSKKSKGKNDFNN